MSRKALTQARNSRALRALGVSLCALVCLTCAAKTERVGGETNWLTACSNDGDCESSTCSCGACTRECTNDGDCRDGAVCAPGDGAAIAAQCGEPRPALCLPGCTRDNDCSSEQRCVAGGCVLSGASGPGGNGVTNPTGDCVAMSDGSGIEHNPGADSVYLPDCEAPLSREYYRVFVQEDGTAYMFPRPDNHPDFYGPCRDVDDPLQPVLERYDLCQEEAFDAEQVARVNAMDPADALAIAHFLHERLVFVTEEYGVRPGPRAEDILELCETDQEFRNGPLRERCDFEIDAARGGTRTEQGWLHTGEAGRVLADALNELYGIRGEALCDRINRNASQSLLVAIDDARECTVDADCVEVWRSTSCFDNCGDQIAASLSSDIEAVKQTLEENQCAAFQRADCSFVPPPCDPPGPPACIDGYCGGPPSEPIGSTDPSSNAELGIIVPPDADGNLPPDLWVGCENGPTFQVSDLEQIVPLEDGDPGGVAEAIEPFLSSGEGDFWPQEDWLILRETPDEILLLHAAEVAFMTVTRTDGQWMWSGSQSVGECPLYYLVPEGRHTVDWRLDPNAMPEPSSTSLDILVTERECVSGQELGDRLLGPELVLTENDVRIAFAAEPPPGDAFDCPANPETAVTVELGEPLGDREIIEGLAIGIDLEDFLP